MPVHKCTIDGKSGYKWGSSGKCYTGPNAESKALAQGVAAIIGGEKMASLKISFDYDDTLSLTKWQEKAKQLKANGNTIYIISARHHITNMLKVADEIGIPHSRIYAVGSNKNKIKKILDLGIDKHYDNNKDVIDALGTKGIQV